MGAIAAALVTAGPSLIRAVGALIGGDAKDVAEHAADAVASATGRADVEQKLTAFTPEQFAALHAIKARLAEIDAEREQAQLNARVESSEQVNATMRAELAATSGYRAGWRPAIGYVCAASFGGLVAALVYAIIQEPSTAAAVVESATVVLASMLAVLGVNVHQRSKDKQTAAGLRPLGIIEALTNRG